MERGRDKQTLLQGCRGWYKTLGCFTQIGFNPRRAIFLCSLLLPLTSTVHLQGASSVLNILQTFHAVFKTILVPSPFYKERSQKKKKIQVHGGILEVFDLNCLLTLGLFIKVFSVCCLCACLSTTLLYPLNWPLPPPWNSPFLTFCDSTLFTYLLPLLSLLWGFDLLYFTFELFKFLCPRVLFQAIFLLPLNLLSRHYHLLLWHQLPSNVDHYKICSSNSASKIQTYLSSHALKI